MKIEKDQSKKLVWAMTLYYPEAHGGRGLHDQQAGVATAEPGQTALDVFEQVKEYVHNRSHPLKKGHMGPAIVVMWWLADGRPLELDPAEGPAERSEAAR